MSALPLSLIVITRNEAANIARCLDSVPFAAEKIIVDSGSTDGTQAIAQARRHQDEMVAQLHIDLDHFKTINDSLGERIGDRLLQAVATRLQQCTREGDSLGCLGGNGFGICLAALRGSNDAALVAGKVLDTLSRPFHVEDHELHVSASIGVGLFPSDGSDASARKRGGMPQSNSADTAMRGSSRQPIDTGCARTGAAWPNGNEATCCTCGICANRSVASARTRAALPHGMSSSLRTRGECANASEVIARLRGRRDHGSNALICV